MALLATVSFAVIRGATTSKRAEVFFKDGSSVSKNLITSGNFGFMTPERVISSATCLL